MSGAASCPGCHGAMQRRAYARKPMGQVEIDLCLDCQGIWFDQFESAQLTPGAVIELFRTIHASHGSGARPLGSRLPCPRCRKPLAATNDIQRNQRITYYRCADGHGRFSTFFQFLREKEFVRELTYVEIAKLRAVVAQVRCNSCGAPVDLARNAHCAYCRSPVSILDPDAVQRTLATLADSERKRTTVDPAALAKALLAQPPTRADSPLLQAITADVATADPVADLLGVAFHLLFDS